MIISSQNTLLAIDDTPENMNFWLKFLPTNNFKVLVAKSGQQGIEMANDTPPDLILLNVMMPDMNGFEVCQHFKSEEKTQKIPIIFITELTNIADKVKGFEVGIADCITKPIQYQELLARVSTHVKLYQQQQKINQQNQQLKNLFDRIQELFQQLQELAEKLIERTAALNQANQKLKYLSHSDGLTQIANRRYFDEYLASEWKRLTREQSPLSLIFADIDYFKKYNDNYGHQAGDDCLQQTAQGIKNVVNRSSDLVARYGGEEFVVLLPKTDLDGAMHIAKNIQYAIGLLNLDHACSPVCEHVTLSMGIASQIPQLNLSPESLIKQADDALYEAKKQGRNCIIKAL